MDRALRARWVDLAMHVEPTHARPCKADTSCYNTNCEFMHSAKPIICPLGRNCMDVNCAIGNHPPECRNGYYCPYKCTSCIFRHTDLAQHAMARATNANSLGLTIMLEIDSLLFCLSYDPIPGKEYHQIQFDVDDEQKTMYLYLREGAIDFVNLLKTKCSKLNNIHLAIYTHLDASVAHPAARLLDPSGVLFIYHSSHNKSDPSSPGESMRDMAAIWKLEESPSHGHSIKNTIMIDCSVRRMRQFPENLIYVPPFDREAVIGERFRLSDVSFYLDVVIHDWYQQRHAKMHNKDIRVHLNRHLSPHVRRQHKILILLDLNGTLMYRSLSAIGDKPFHKPKTDIRRYYFRPFAKELISFLIEKKNIEDCVDIAFYSSMTVKNATAAAVYLDEARRMFVYGREFNQPDLSTDNKHDVIRNLRALWSCPGTPAFGHSEFNTIMIDDTVRKMREFPRNMVRVPEYTSDAVENGESFHLSALMNHLSSVIDMWQRDYRLDRDIRDVLDVLNTRFYKGHELDVVPGAEDSYR